MSRDGWEPHLENAWRSDEKTAKILKLWSDRSLSLLLSISSMMCSTDPNQLFIDSNTVPVQQRKVAWKNLEYQDILPTEVHILDRVI